MVLDGATLINIVACFVFLCIISEIRSTSPAVPWYEDLPAVAMDYKVHIDPGKEDCYYQYVNPGATFYVSFQVSILLIRTNFFSLCYVRNCVRQFIVFF